MIYTLYLSGPQHLGLSFVVQQFELLSELFPPLFQELCVLFLI